MAFWDWEDSGPFEEPTVRRLSLRQTLRHIRMRLRPHRGTIAVGVVLLLVSVAAELAGPLVLRKLIDADLASALQGGSSSGIWRRAGLYLAVFLIGSTTNFFQTLLTARMGLELVTRLKQDSFQHLLGLGADYFDHNPPGRLLARVESDAERLQLLFSEVGLALLRCVVLLLGTLAVMLATDVRITLWVIALIAPLFAGSLLFLHYMRGPFGRVRKLWARLSTFVTEYVQAVPILQVYGRTPWALGKLVHHGRARYRLEYRTEFLEYGFWSLFFTIEVLAVMLILYLGFGGMFSGALTLGTLVLFIEYTRRLFFPIVLFAEQLNFVQRAFASADRVFGVLETPSQVADSPGALAEIPPDWKVIAFENVSFAYQRQGTGELVPALDNVSFQIRRGERVALVGPSGGGKTTITNLLLRFYEPTSGSITCDGIDLRRITQKAWRSRLGLVLQDIHLFPGTVADNLRVFTESIPEETLVHSVRAIGAEEALRRLPKGIMTPLAEGGQNLSMGERQLISFARALVRDPDLLILDEATSSVDPATERRIQESLARMLAGRTALVVAHRLSTVTSADRILVVQHGQIVEEGSHADLFHRGGLYRALFDLQFQAGETV